MLFYMSNAIAAAVGKSFITNAMGVIGKIVAARRDELGLNQAQLAAKSNVKQETISNLETGRNKTSRELAKIASALGLVPLALSNGKKVVRGTPPRSGAISEYAPV